MRLHSVLKQITSGLLTGTAAACESLDWGLVKKGGEGRETRLGAAALEKQIRAGLKKHNSKSQPTWVQIQLLRVCCVALGKSHNPTVLQCPHPKKDSQSAQEESLLIFLLLLLA